MFRQQTVNENLYLACRSRQKKRNSMTLLHIACHKTRFQFFSEIPAILYWKHY